MLLVCLGSAVMVLSVGLASVVVKAYSNAPPILVITFRHLFDFLFALAEACCRLAFIVLLFLYNVITHCLGSFIDIVPAVYYIISTLFSFTIWVCVHLIRGLLGLETKALNTLSWLIAICVLFLYFETKYQNSGINIFFERRPQLARFLIRNRRNENDYDVNNNEDQVILLNEEADVVPEQLQLQENQLLEIENRENENEENALEEADRNRVNIDNVQNDQRELDRDRAEQVQTAHHQLDDDDDDSSDFEIDPTMCSVCLHRVRGAALFPCGHTQLCRICARIIIAADRPCPMCQTPIQELRNVYV